MKADYRVRIQIRQSLENNYFHNSNQPFASNIAFQVAFCYQIGFGVKSNDIQRRLWLERSLRKPDDLKIEKEAVRPARWKSKTMRKLNGLGHIDLIHEYRISGLNKLDQACNEYEREVSDMEREFGGLHFVCLASMNNLASIFWNQGRSKEAEVLDVQVMETRKRVLGQEHPDTLTSMANLASTYRNQGRLKEAEELLVQVIETLKRVLGQEHPSTLNSMNNLASTYRNQGRSKEAEELEVQVMETRKRVHGHEHLDTLASMNNLASTYMSQGRRKEAEELQIEVVNRLRTTLGDNHPIIVQAIANLASFREERAAPQHLSGVKELMERIRDRLQQFAASWSLNEGNDSQERFQRTLKMVHKQATEDDDPITDEERLQLALAMFLEVDDNNDTDEERLQCTLAMSIEGDEDNETNGDRLQRALAMLMKNENDDDDICCFKREYLSYIAGRPILDIAGIY